MSSAGGSGPPKPPGRGTPSNSGTASKPSEGPTDKLREPLKDKITVQTLADAKKWLQKEGFLLGNAPPGIPTIATWLIQMAGDKNNKAHETLRAIAYVLRNLPTDTAIAEVRSLGVAQIQSSWRDTNQRRRNK